MTKVTIDEYRKITGDQKTKDETIEYRLNYLRGLCQNIIRYEIDSYINKKQQESKSFPRKIN